LIRFDDETLVHSRTNPIQLVAHSTLGFQIANYEAVDAEKNHVAALMHKCDDRTRQKDRDGQRLQIALKRGLTLWARVRFGLTAWSKGERLIIGTVASPIAAAPSPRLASRRDPPLLRLKSRDRSIRSAEAQPQRRGVRIVGGSQC
jgi:hypothetical protein